MFRKVPARQILFSATVAAITASVVWAGPPAKLALTGGRIIPVVGNDLDKGTVLIENGLITAVGTSVQIPYDAMEVDCSGMVIMPGMVDAHSANGLDIRNENLPVTPFLDVYDAIDPSRTYFEDALRDGITTIHTIVANNCVIGGLSRAIHPIGLTPDEMTLEAPVALKLSIAPKRGWDRMVQMATFRETFLELADYLETLAEKKYEESLEEKDEKIDVGPEEARKRGKALVKREDYDDKHRNLVLLTTGQLGAFVYCGEPSDVARAIDLGKRNGFLEHMTLVLGPRCYKAVADVKASGLPVVLDANLLYRERNPVTGEMKETFVPKVYYDNGVAFSLLPNSFSSMAERYLNYQAARCVRHGMGRQEALEAITINPAKACGIGERVGSIEPGKVANLVVMNGDPLDFNSLVDSVYINGIRAYDRASDVRLQQLLGDEPTDVVDPDEEGAADEGAADEGAAKDGDKAGGDSAPAGKADSKNSGAGDSEEGDGESVGSGWPEGGEGGGK
ncbi:MAG: amidohydrolase family protein [Planctomycetota bacterium]